MFAGSLEFGKICSFGLAFCINDHLLVKMHDEHHHDPHGEGHQADGGQLDRILSTNT